MDRHIPTFKKKLWANFIFSNFQNFSTSFCISKFTFVKFGSDLSQIVHFGETAGRVGQVVGRVGDTASIESVMNFFFLGSNLLPYWVKINKLK